MKKIKQFHLPVLLLLALLISITGCNITKTEEASQTALTCEGGIAMGAAGSKALYIYVCGSDLETGHGSATKNLKELLAADIPEDMQIIIETGGARKWRKYDIDSESISRYIVEDGQLRLLETCPQASMGSGDTLADFLSYSVKHYPAEQMGVILWDHGSGSINGVCFDENYDMDSLTLTELDQAFRTVRSQMTDDFAFVGFDACLMANYETANIIAKYAKNMVASEELEPSGGWDYTALASFGTDAFYDTLLSGYADKCVANEKETYTLSHIDLEGFQTLSDQYEAFIALLRESAKTGMRTIIQSASSAMGFGNNSSTEGYSNLIDLAWFAENMGDTDLKAALADVVHSVNGKQKEGATGISMYYPLSDISDMDAYLELSESDAYKAFLTENYISAENDGTLIQFTDKGSDENGELHIVLSSESEKYVARVLYYACQFISGENEDELLTISLGIDNEVIETSDNGYTTVFAGEWIKWNDEFLQIEATDVTGSLTTFSTPARVDDVEGNIRFVYDEDTQECTLQGFLPASENGSVARVEEVEAGAKITLRHQMYEDNMDEVWYDGNTFSYKKGQDMELAPLENGFYMTLFAVVDLFGNAYFSNPATIVRIDDKNNILSIPEATE